MIEPLERGLLEEWLQATTDADEQWAVLRWRAQSRLVGLFDEPWIVLAEFVEAWMDDHERTQSVPVDLTTRTAIALTSAIGWRAEPPD